MRTLKLRKDGYKQHYHCKSKIHKYTPSKYGAALRANIRPSITLGNELSSFGNLKQTIELKALRKDIIESEEQAIKDANRRIRRNAKNRQKSYKPHEKSPEEKARDALSILGIDKPLSNVTADDIKPAYISSYRIAEAAMLNPDTNLFGNRLATDINVARENLVKYTESIAKPINPKKKNGSTIPLNRSLTPYGRK